VNLPSSEAYLVLEPSGRRYGLAQGQSWAIGRGDGCAVMLDNRSVSRLHALIQRRETGDFSLVDLGSRNGSFVNSRRVSVPVVLNDQDHLLFGDQQLAFRQPVRAAHAVPVDDAGRNAPTTALHMHSLATIVVVDIRDFTPLARTVSESLLSQTIGTWFLRTGKIAQSLGSWAQKYIGDAVMAVWVHDRVPDLRADVLRALQAVSQMDAATAEISQALPLPGPLRIGAGINTGPAILSGADYTAIGDTVNAAFRLEAATKTLGLNVAVGPRTAAELGLAGKPPFIEREVELKGYEGPSRAWAISFEDLGAYVRAAG
jgi:adenylate cyclase